MRIMTTKCLLAALEIGITTAMLVVLWGVAELIVWTMR